MLALVVSRFRSLYSRFLCAKPAHKKFDCVQALCLVLRLFIRPLHSAQNDTVGVTLALTFRDFAFRLSPWRDYGADRRDRLYLQTKITFQRLRSASRLPQPTLRRLFKKGGRKTFYALGVTLAFLHSLPIVLFIRADDALHELMAHHVFIGEMVYRYILYPLDYLYRS